MTDIIITTAWFDGLILIVVPLMRLTLWITLVGASLVDQALERLAPTPDALIGD